jgi:hypothetical protein
VEVQRIGGAKAAVYQLIPRLQKHVDALPRVHFEVVPALWADVQIGFVVGLVNGLAASKTLDPQTLRADSPLAVTVLRYGRNIAIFAFEPGHSASVIVNERQREQMDRE